MKREEINTGSEQFDNWLNILFDFYKSEEYSQLKKAISNPKITEDELRKFIPIEIFYLFNSLKTPDIYEKILKITKNVVPIEKAKKIMHEGFTGLINHPLYNKISKDTEVEVEEKDPHIEFFNIPERISFIPFLNGYPPRLQPSVRIGLINSSEKLIFETMLQLDDLCFMASGFLRAIGNLLSNYEKLMDEQQIEIGYIKTRRIEKTMKLIDERISLIKEVLPKYGIKIS